MREGGLPESEGGRVEQRTLFLSLFFAVVGEEAVALCVCVCLCVCRTAKGCTHKVRRRGRGREGGTAPLTKSDKKNEWAFQNSALSFSLSLLSLSFSLFSLSSLSLRRRSDSDGNNTISEDFIKRLASEHNIGERTFLAPSLSLFRLHLQPVQHSNRLRVRQLRRPQIKGEPEGERERERV